MKTEKKYQIIYADPPWSYDDKSCSGNAEKHYNCMTDKEIYDLPIRNLADDNCILFIWGTFPKLPEVLKTIKEWGFEYKSIGFLWLKKNKKNGKYFYGLGRWTRGNSEPCFIATRGKPKRINESVFQIIESPLREHSRKPDVIRNKIIELVGDLPRIELFARQRTEGWDVWGEESPTYIQRNLNVERRVFG